MMSLNANKGSANANFVFALFLLVLTFANTEFANAIYTFAFSQILTKFANKQFAFV